MRRLEADEKFNMEFGNVTVEPMLNQHELFEMDQ